MMAKYKYNADEVRDLLLSVDAISDEDTASEDEIDQVEIRGDSSDDNLDDGEEEREEETNLISEKNNLIPDNVVESDEMIIDNNDNELYYGRQTKKKPPFLWYSNPEKNNYSQKNHFGAEFIPQVTAETSIIDFFDMIVSKDMISKITKYTNKRIIKKTNQKEVIESEIRAFLGLLILFGISDKTRFPITQIWKDESLHFTRFAQAAMSRERYQLISKNITFDDVDTRKERETNKFFKMEELFNMFKKNIKLMNPSSCVTVDEELYPFRGKVKFRQYIKSKPARYGIKYWLLVDLETSYLLDVNVYLGKANENCKKEANIGMKAVLKLCEPFFHSNRCVTADNFFSSIELCKQLWEKDLTYIGTLRANKTEIPQLFLANKTRAVGSVLFGFKEFLTLTSYVPKANKAVFIISTHHHQKRIDLSTNKPQTVIDYNHTKGGVDTFDHLLAINSCRRKTNRWTLNCFMFLLDAACQNAFSLNKLKCKKFNQKLDSNKAKQEGLETIGTYLINENIEFRNMQAALNNYKHISKNVKTAFNHFLAKDQSKSHSLPNSPCASPKPVKSGSGRCKLCAFTEKKNHKHTNICFKCNIYICKEHMVLTCLTCEENKI